MDKILNCYDLSFDTTYLVCKLLFAPFAHSELSPGFINAIYSFLNSSEYCSEICLTSKEYIIEYDPNSENILYLNYSIIRELSKFLVYNAIKKRKTILIRRIQTLSSI